MFKSNKPQLKTMSDIESERKTKTMKTPQPTNNTKTIHIVYIAILVTIAVAIGMFFYGMHIANTMNADKESSAQTAVKQYAESLKASTPQQ